MLRKATLFVLASALLVAAPAQAQSLEEVLKNYYEAIGGKQAWLDLESVKMTGRIGMGQGMEAPFTLIQKRPENSRLEFTLQGMTAIMAYDGETAWMVMPFMGKTEPEEVPEADAENIYEMAEIESPLINYVDKGHQVEYVGTEEVQGTQAHKLKLTRDDGDIEYYYLDAEYYVPIMRTTSREVRGNTMAFDEILSDYKDVGGLMIPHSRESRPEGAAQGQVVTIEQVELNVEAADSLFAMPEPTEAGGEEGQN